MQSTKFTCPHRRNEFWQTESKPSFCTSLYAGRMRCKICRRKIVKKIVRKTTYSFERTRGNTPKYLRAQEFRRVKHASGNREDIARRGTLFQFHQRVANGRTRLYTDKQYIQRITEFKHDAQSSQTHLYITQEVIKKMYVLVVS